MRTAYKNPEAEISALRAENQRLRDERDAALQDMGAHVGNELLALVRQEFGLSNQQGALIVLLYNAHGRVLTKWFINEHLPPVGGKDRVETADKIIDVHVCNIRSLIGKTAILTVWGQGYALSKDTMNHIDQLIKREDA